MEGTREKDRLNSVNIVFLVTMAISIVANFLPLEFLYGRPVLQILFSQGILALPAAVFMIKEKMPYRRTVRLKKMKATDIAMTLLFGILLQPVLTLINGISLVFSSNTTNTFLLGFTENTPFLVTLLLVAVLPCVAEESVYRGFFYQEYRRVNPWKAVVLSGVLFGLMHGNLNQFCYATVMGIVFALLIEATGSLLSTMLVHFLVNGLSVVMIYVYPHLYELVKKMYQIYLDMGESEIAESLAASFGDMTLTGREWLEQTMTTTVEIGLADVIGAYLLPAVISGVLAYWVYRSLAIRSGNWERIRMMFAGKRKHGESGEEAGEVQEKSLLTAALMIAIAAGVLFIFFYEMLMRLPR